MDWLIGFALFIIGALVLITLLVELIGWSERRRRDKLIKLERELLDAAINDALKRRGE
jgi:FtsZ-interacting cell division protein ZipA